jgi:hypothetical protein
VRLVLSAVLHVLHVLPVLPFLFVMFDQHVLPAGRASSGSCTDMSDSWQPHATQMVYGVCL